MASSITRGASFRLGVRRLLRLWAGAALLGCASGPAPTDPDSALPSVADDSCAQYAFRFAAEGCPADECSAPVCTCPSTIACIPGKNERCMIGVDCTLACAADPETLLACAVDIAPCRVDADCSEGLCVTEPGAVDGECESGERGARCRNDRDCLVGNCVAGQGGNRACSPGEERDLCNRATDCLSMRCVLLADELFGTCEA